MGGWVATVPSSFRIKEPYAAKSVLPNLSFSARNAFMSFTNLQVSVGNVLPIWNLSVGVWRSILTTFAYLKKKRFLVLEVAWGSPLSCGWCIKATSLSFGRVSAHSSHVI